MTIDVVVDRKTEREMEDGSILIEIYKTLKISPDENGQVQTDRKELVRKAFSQIRSKSAAKELLIYCTQLALDNQFD